MTLRASFTNSKEIWYFFTPSPLCAQNLQIACEFAAFLNPLPLSKRTSYMEAPFQDVAMDDLQAAQENRLCQDAQDGVEHCAEHPTPIRPGQRRRVPASGGAQLPGQHAQALPHRESRQGRREREGFQIPKWHPTLWGVVMF